MSESESGLAKLSSEFLQHPARIRRYRFLRTGRQVLCALGALVKIESAPALAGLIAQLPELGDDVPPGYLDTWQQAVAHVLDLLYPLAVELDPEDPDEAEDASPVKLVRQAL